jgi:hypothetical protein
MFIGGIRVSVFSKRFRNFAESPGGGVWKAVTLRVAAWALGSHMGCCIMPYLGPNSGVHDLVGVPNQSPPPTTPSSYGRTARVGRCGQNIPYGGAVAKHRSQAAPSPSWYPLGLQYKPKIPSHMKDHFPEGSPLSLSCVLDSSPQYHAPKG